MRQKMFDQEAIEQEIKSMLEEIHHGKGNALPRGELCNIFVGVGERDLRKTIKHLVIKHGCPIGSCPRGYFWAETAEEIEGVCKYYKSYALSSLQVVSRLKKEPLEKILGQLTFEDLGGPAGAGSSQLEKKGGGRAA
jgi:hypothetical protein